jgi:hypothetical protein
MGYWKAIFVSLIVLSILSAIAYGWAYVWYVIIWKGTLTSFDWMYTFVILLSIIYAVYKSDQEE